MFVTWDIEQWSCIDQSFEPVLFFASSRPTLIWMTMPESIPQLTSGKKRKTPTVWILKVEPEFVNCDQGPRPSRPVPAHHHQGTFAWSNHHRNHHFMTFCVILCHCWFHFYIYIIITAISTILSWTSMDLLLISTSCLFVGGLQTTAADHHLFSSRPNLPVEPAKLLALPRLPTKGQTAWLCGCRQGGRRCGWPWCHLQSTSPLPARAKTDRPSCWSLQPTGWPSRSPPPSPGSPGARSGQKNSAEVPGEANWRRDTNLRQSDLSCQESVWALTEHRVSWSVLEKFGLNVLRTSETLQ